MMSSDQQWLLIQTGNFDEGKQAEFQGVGSQFDVMQHQVQLAIESGNQWARVRPKSEIRALPAAVLAGSAVLILFLRLQKQEHLSQLQETERNALRESEERFRALSEQSTDCHPHRRFVWSNQIHQSFRSCGSCGAGRSSRGNEHQRSRASRRYCKNGERGICFLRNGYRTEPDTGVSAETCRWKMAPFRVRCSRLDTKQKHRRNCL